jgi:hypothetical protein
VPARAAASPGRFPLHFLRFVVAGMLPQHEVERILLAGHEPVRRRAGLRATGQLAIAAHRNFKRSVESPESPNQPWVGSRCLPGWLGTGAWAVALSGFGPPRRFASRSLGLDFGVDPEFSAIQSACGRSATGGWRQAAQPVVMCAVSGTVDAAQAASVLPRLARSASGPLAGRAGPVARPLARHKQSTGLLVSGLGGCGSSPRWVRIFSITGRSRMAAMILSSPAPQLGQCCMSMSKAQASAKTNL